MVKRCLFILILAGLPILLLAQPPRVLVVMAHPDDESTFSVTLYKIAKEHNGVVDLFVITNGEAGFKYSTLAEQYYNVALTNEQTGRAKLPAIRKKELKDAGKILGVHHCYFEDQVDNHYTLNEKEPLDTSWHVPAVKSNLTKLLAKGRYDFVFCLLPEVDTHGQHKAATLLALNVVAALPAKQRPVILGAVTENKNDPPRRFSQYNNYLLTQTVTDTALFKVDRNASFSYKNRISYKIIANWEIAAHKSQGFTEMSFNDGDVEAFWPFKLNRPEALKKAQALFETLKITPYPVKTY